MIFEVIAPQPYGVILPTILGYREIKENNMASKCTKCGNTDNYNFALNIGLCDICIGEKLEQQSGRIKELEAEKIECRQILEKQLDRDKDQNDSLRDLVAVACNALYWARAKKRHFKKANQLLIKNKELGEVMVIIQTEASEGLATMKNEERPDIQRLLRRISSLVAGCQIVSKP